MTSRLELVRDLLNLAGALDRDGLGSFGGLLRRAARELAELPAAPEPEAGRCRGCGCVLPRHRGRGRPRKWCAASDCQKRRKNAA